MRLLGWHLGFRKRSVGLSSSFANALLRVGRIRESCMWNPVTGASTIEERKHRVDEARQRVRYDPIPYVATQIPSLRKVRLFRWLFGVLFVILCAAIAAFAFLAIVIARDWKHVAPSNNGFLYRLPSTPGILSEDLAVTKAMDALARSGVDTKGWVPVARTGETSAAPGGPPDVYLFRDKRDPGLAMVDFQSLVNTNLRATVSIQFLTNWIRCSVFGPNPSP